MDMNDQTSSTICRTCAKLGSSEMHSIFRMDQSLQFELIPCVKDFFLNTLKINSSDSLPQKMCTACYDLFKSTNAFFEQCENARDSLEKMFKEQLAAPEIELMSVDKVIQYVEPKSEYEEDNSTEDDHFDDEDCDVDHHDSDIELGEYIKPELNEKESDKHKKPAKEQLAAPEIELMSVDKVIQYVEPKSEYEEDNSTEDDHFDDEDCDVDHHDSDRKLDEYIKPELNEKESDKHKKPAKSKRRIKTELNCKLCGMKFKRKYDINRHILTSKHKENLINQEKQSETEQIDGTKLDNETEDNTVTAEDTTPDSKRLVSEKDLEELKSEGSQLVCPICKKVFTTIGNRNIHMENHSQVNKYKCDKCQKSFKVRRNLSKHIKNTHGIAEYSCEHCNKKYNDEGRYKEHLKTHDDPNTIYECKYCSEKFNELQAVLDHEKTHAGPKPFTCRICNVGFAKKYYLKNHLKIHTGEQNFKCKICDVAFIHRSTYVGHMWKHKGNRPRPFICEHCGKDFVTKVSLRYHLYTHRGEKPYKCEPCDKAFALKGQLWNHNAAFHGGPMRVRDLKKPVTLVIPAQPVDEDCDVDHHDSDIELGEYIKPELNEKESDKHKKPAEEQLAARKIELMSVDKVILYVEPKSEYEEDNSTEDDHFDDDDCDVDHHDFDIELDEYLKPELNEKESDKHKKPAKEQLAAPEIELMSVDKVIQYVEPKSEYEEDNSSEDDHFDDDDCDVDHHDFDIELDEYLKPELNEKESDKHKKPAKEQLAAPEIELMSVDKVIQYVEPKSEYEEDNSTEDDHFDDEDCDVDQHDSDIELGEYIKPELNEKESDKHNKPAKSKRRIKTELNCKLCGMKFKRKYDINRHILTSKHKKNLIIQEKQSDSEQIDGTKLDNETEDNTVTAEDTTPDSKRLVSEKDLEELKSEGSQLVCPICKKVFTTVGNRNIHMGNHSQVNKYKCDKCQKSFKVRRNLSKHIKTTHGIAEYSCEHCNKKYNDERRYKEHLKTHDDPNTIYECKYCSEKFNELQAVLDHEKTHAGPKPFTCRICNVGFAKKYYLKNHLKIHTGEQNFKCKICDVAFIYRNTYVGHMWKHKGNRPRPFICEHCGKDFVTKVSLRYHLYTHRGEKPYKCEPCDKAFALKGQLWNHNAAFHGGPMRVRDLKKPVTLVIPAQPVFVEKLESEMTDNNTPNDKKLPFVCTACNKGFKLPHGLSKHFQKMHTEIRAFPCTMCEQSFKKKEGLLSHVNGVHLKLKPHTCKICSKSFTQSGTLRIHMRTHTGEKPYACTICDKAFAIQRVMRQHMRSHSGEKAYKCEICSEDFRHYTTLARHVKLIHKNWTTCSVNEVQNIKTDATVPISVPRYVFRNANKTID